MHGHAGDDDSSPPADDRTRRTIARGVLGGAAIVLLTGAAGSVIWARRARPRSDSVPVANEPAPIDADTRRPLQPSISSPLTLPPRSRPSTPLALPRPSRRPVPPAAADALSPLHAFAAFSLATLTISALAGGLVMSLRWGLDVDNMEDFNWKVRAILRGWMPTFKERMHRAPGKEDYTSRLPPSSTPVTTAFPSTSTEPVPNIDNIHTWSIEESQNRLSQAFAEGGFTAWSTQLGSELEAERQWGLQQEARRLQQAPDRIDVGRSAALGPTAPVPESNASQAIKDIAFGSAAGMVSKVFEHPFDLCKVRLQAQVLDQTARFSGPIDCLHQTWKNEGIRGLYRGLPAPIVGAMVENAVLFFANGQLQNVVRSMYGMPRYTVLSDGTSQPTRLSLGQFAAAAGAAGAVTSFFLTPIELVKCRMQVQMLAAEVRSTAALQSVLPGASGPRPSFRELQGPWAIISSVVRTDGIRGLWLGQTGTLFRESGGSAAWFTANDLVSRFFLRRRAKQLNRDPAELSKKDLKPWESVIAGACAGVSYNTVLYPADSVKSAIQTEEELRPRTSPNQARATFIGTFRAIYTAKGIRGLYAGMGITLARSAPSSGMIFLMYDQLQKAFG